jgi:hypothetical protein
VLVILRSRILCERDSLAFNECGNYLSMYRFLLAIVLSAIRFMDFDYLPLYHQTFMDFDYPLCIIKHLWILITPLCIIKHLWILITPPLYHQTFMYFDYPLCIIKHLCIFIISLCYHMAFFLSYPLSAIGSDIRIKGWWGNWYEKSCVIIFWSNI